MDAEAIRRALRQLDASKDDHWTTDGQPRVDIVGQLLGAPISRDAITAVAPDFSRTATVLEEPARADPAMPHDPKAPPKEMSDEARTYLEISGKLAELYAARNELSNDITALEREQSKLARFAPNPKRRTSAEDTRGRLAVIQARTKNLQERMARLRAAGIEPNMARPRPAQVQPLNQPSQ